MDEVYRVRHPPTIAKVLGEISANKIFQRRKLWLPSLDTYRTLVAQNTPCSNPIRPFIAYNIPAEHNEPSSLGTTRTDSSNGAQAEKARLPAWQGTRA